MVSELIMDIGAFVETYRKDDMELIPLLRTIGLLKPATYFVCCDHTPMTESIMEQEGQSSCLQYKCDHCGEKKLATSGSVLHHCKMSFYTFVLLIKCFVLEMNMSQAMETSQMSYSAVSKVYNTCWNICAKFLSKYPVRIGGTGEICELREVQLGKKKQPKEEKVLYFGVDAWCIILTERRRKVSYIFFAKNKTRDTVIPPIKEHIAVGTSIVMEETGSDLYDTLPLEGYHFSKVSFEEEKADPPGGWDVDLSGPILAQLKYYMRMRGWAGLNTVQDYINEYLFRRFFLNQTNVAADKFLRFCATVQDVY